MPDGRYLTNRDAYIRMKYGLLPRNRLVGIQHAGWKNPKMSDNKQNYMQVHWFPRQWGYLFMQVWKMYMAQRIHNKIPDTHPFLLYRLMTKIKVKCTPLNHLSNYMPELYKRLDLQWGIIRNDSTWTQTCLRTTFK